MMTVMTKSGIFVRKLRAVKRNIKEKIIQRFISVFLFILDMDEKYINEQYLYM